MWTNNFTPRYNVDVMDETPEPGKLILETDSKAGCEGNGGFSHSPLCISTKMYSADTRVLPADNRFCTFRYVFSSVFWCNNSNCLDCNRSKNL